MKYKLNIQEGAPLGPLYTVQLSLTNECPPDYNYKIPSEHRDGFEAFGLIELMEGVFEFPKNKLNKIDDFLSNLGYEKE